MLRTFLLTLLLNLVHLNESFAQWDYAITDTLTYHNHTNGKLKLQGSTNTLFSLQQVVGSTQFRLDKRVNNQWSNVLTGTDAIDFEITPSSIYLLKVQANQFVLEKYDLNAQLLTSSTCALMNFSAQLGMVQMRRNSGDTLFIQFVDPNYVNGGTVIQYSSGNWQNLNAVKFADIELSSQGIPIGLIVNTTMGTPASTSLQVKKYNFGTGLWELEGAITESYASTVAPDMCVSEDDSVFLASVGDAFPASLYLYAIKGGNVSEKQVIQGIEPEVVTSVSIVEDRTQRFLITYTNHALGPWGDVYQRRWNWHTQLWIPLNPSAGCITDSQGTEYTGQNPLLRGAVVDSLNTYFVGYSYQTNWFQNPQQSPDSTHTHVRRFLNCSYLNGINTVSLFDDTLFAQAGNGVSYQWWDCLSQQVVPGANNAVYPNPVPGEYSVIISNEGCVDTSACIKLVNDLGIVETEHEMIQLYPNPVSVSLHVLSDVPVSNIQIFDSFGRLCFSKSSGLTLTELNVSELNPGMYLVQITTTTGEVIIRRAQLN